MKDYLPINPRISLLRMLMLFGGIAILVMGWIIRILPNTQFDPLPYLGSFAIACFIIFYLSYKNDWVFKNIEKIISVLTILYAGCLGYLLISSHLDPIAALWNYISLLGITLIISRIRVLALFLIGYFTFFTIIAFTIQSPQIDIFVFLTFLYTTGILGFIIVKYLALIQNELASSNRDFQILVDSIQESIFLVSKDFRVIKINKNGIKTISNLFTRKITEGSLILDYLYDDQKDKFKISFSNALEGKIIDIERKLFRADDEAIWFQFKYIPVEDSDGEINAVLFSALDITSKKNSSEALAQSENKFRTIFEEAPVSMAILSPNGTILQVNPSFTETFGFLESDLFNKQLTEIIHPEEKEEVQNKINLLTNEQVEEFRTEMRFQKKGEEFIHVIGRVTLISNLNKPDFLLAQIVDIDQIKKSEEMLKSKNKELEKANAELDKFVYSAAHDLRAPLTSVLGLINILRLDKESNLGTYIDLIEKSVIKLDYFIKDVMDYSMNSRLGISNQPVALKSIITKAFDNHRYVNGQSKINSIIEINDNEVFYNDTGRLEIILNNLISNSIKYHDPEKSESRREV